MGSPHVPLLRQRADISHLNPLGTSSTTLQLAAAGELFQAARQPASEASSALALNDNSAAPMQAVARIESRAVETFIIAVLICVNVTTR